MTYENGVLSLSVKGIPINFSIVELGQILDIKMNKFVSLQGYVKKYLYYEIGRLIEHEFFQKRKKVFGGKILNKNSLFVFLFSTNT